MKILKFMTAVLLLCSSVACRHKDFWDDEPLPQGDIHVEVEYDDDNDPDDALIIRDQISATRIWTYHRQSGEMVFATDMGRTANLLPLGSDTYHFIAYNTGTQTISFANARHFYRHGIYTRECDILEPFYDSRATKSDIDLGNSQQVVIAAEPIWNAYAESRLANLGDTVRMTAIPLHCRYSFEMRNIKGLKGVVRASSFITGMSFGASLGSSELHDIPVTVAVPARVGEDGKSIVGNFMCFGQNPRIDTRHRMGLFLEFANGARYKFIEGDHFDVTDQVVSAKNRRRVHIVIDGIEIPEQSSPDAGFDITVNPWGDGENLDIEYEF